MYLFGIHTSQQQAAFLAIIAHESGEFRWTEEIWGPTTHQRRYEPPSSLAKSLGNTQPGDGKRFKGRGVCSVTGRKHYQRLSDELDIDFIAKPKLMSSPEVSVLVAAQYWVESRRNEQLAAGGFRSLIHRPSGSLSGILQRTEIYERAMKVFGVADQLAVKAATSPPKHRVARKPRPPT
jgi:predicted chitinase